MRKFTRILMLGFVVVTTLFLTVHIQAQDSKGFTYQLVKDKTPAKLVVSWDNGDRKTVDVDLGEILLEYQQDDYIVIVGTEGWTVYSVNTEPTEISGTPQYVRYTQMIWNAELNDGDKLVLYYAVLFRTESGDSKGLLPALSFETRTPEGYVVRADAQAYPSKPEEWARISSWITTASKSITKDDIWP